MKNIHSKLTLLIFLIGNIVFLHSQIAVDPDPDATPVEAVVFDSYYEILSQQQLTNADVIINTELTTAELRAIERAVVDARPEPTSTQELQDIVDRVLGQQILVAAVVQ